MNFLPKAINQFASRLKFPQLFFLFLMVFVLDLLIPDFIPFIDEILFGLITLMFGMWKKRKEKVKLDDTQDLETTGQKGQ